MMSGDKRRVNIFWDSRLCGGAIPITSCFRFIDPLGLEERYEAMGVGEYQEDYCAKLRRGYQPTTDEERRWPVLHGYLGRAGPNEGTQDENSATWARTIEQKRRT